jgi:hypothetical protein
MTQATTRRRILWTPEEDALLLSMSGDLPWPVVVSNMQKAAAAKQWPRRTARAITDRVYTLGVSRTCYGEWLTCHAITRELRVDKKTINKWINQGKIEAKKINRIRWVSRKTLRAFAKREPQVFAHLTEAELFQLLDSEQLAQQIKGMRLPRRQLRKPVVCVETGWWYPSLTAAAKSVYMTNRPLRRAIQNGTTVAGKHWRYA